MQARLELEVQRLSGELAAAERKLELKAADLEAERDRVAAQATLLECKVRSRICKVVLSRFCSRASSV